MNTRRLGKYLDLNDVAAGHPVAEKELAELILAKKRYEKVRRMTSREFSEIWRYNLEGDNPMPVRDWKTFDELVDEYTADN